MSNICMAIFDTEENGRSQYTEQALSSLEQTVDISKHSITIIDNNSCLKTKKLISDFRYLRPSTKLITLSENVGTANAINLGIRLRKAGENVIKMDNDCVINQSKWVEGLEEVIERDETIGIVGLKRKDLAEWPLEDGWAKSEFLALPHVAGQKWICVERVHHVMGTCQMLSSKLLDRLGFFLQPSVYGYDDSLLSLRSSLAGFKNVFLYHIDIDHVDNGSGDYQQWKQAHAGEVMAEYNQLCKEYMTGSRDLYYGGNFND